MAASENQLWESLYASFFGDLNEHMRVHKCESCGMIAYQKAMHSQMNAVTGVNMMNWRNTFKRVYNGKAKICCEKSRFNTHTYIYKSR